MVEQAGEERATAPGASEVRARLVIRDGVGRDDLDDALAERGCVLINVIAPSQSHPGQMIYATRDRRAVVHLVDDAVLGVTYLAGAGEGAGAELEALRARIAVYGDDDVAPLLASARDEAGLRRALGVLALSAGPEPGAARAAAFEEALGHERPEARLAALVAASYARWPALRERVAQLAASDEDAVVRLHAERVLQVLGS